MISAAGQTPFVAQVNGTTSLFVADTTSRSVLATVGQAVPGAPAGVNYDGFNAPRINSAGRVATTGYVWGPAVTNNTSDAIFVTTDAQPLALVARAGEQAPGAPAGVLYDYFYEANISDDNRVGFFATLRGTSVTTGNDYAIFAGAPGDIHLLARSGDVAPHSGGAIFDYVDWPVLNGSGQSLFKAWFRGPSVTTDNDTAVYLADPDGSLHLLARAGEPFTVAAGDTRTIAGVDFVRQLISGGGDGQPLSLNDAGQVALSIFFTDGSQGIFLASIPEPGAAALVALTLTASLLRRGRRAPAR
jgi:hypothetical protein